MTWICQECDHTNVFWRNYCENCNSPQNGWSNSPTRLQVNSDTPEPGETAAEHASRIRKNTHMGTG